MKQQHLRFLKKKATKWNECVHEKFWDVVQEGHLGRREVAQEEETKGSEGDKLWKARGPQASRSRLFCLRFVWCSVEHEACSWLCCTRDCSHENMSVMGRGEEEALGGHVPDGDSGDGAGWLCPREGGLDAYEVLCSTSLRENVLLSLASVMIEDRE